MLSVVCASSSACETRAASATRSRTPGTLGGNALVECALLADEALEEVEVGWRLLAAAALFARLLEEVQPKVERIKRLPRLGVNSAQATAALGHRDADCGQPLAQLVGATQQLSVLAAAATAAAARRAAAARSLLLALLQRSQLVRKLLHLQAACSCSARTALVLTAITVSTYFVEERRVGDQLLVKALDALELLVGVCVVERAERVVARVKELLCLLHELGELLGHAYRCREHLDAPHRLAVQLIVARVESVNARGHGERLAAARVRADLHSGVIKGVCAGALVTLTSRLSSTMRITELERSEIALASSCKRRTHRGRKARCRQARGALQRGQ